MNSYLQKQVGDRREITSSMVTRARQEMLRVIGRVKYDARTFDLDSELPKVAGIHVKSGAILRDVIVEGYFDYGIYIENKATDVLMQNCILKGNWADNPLKINTSLAVW